MDLAKQSPSVSTDSPIFRCSQVQVLSILLTLHTIVSLTWGMGPVSSLVLHGSVTSFSDDRRRRPVPPDLFPSLSATLFTSLRRDRYDRYVSCARSRRRRENREATPCIEKLLTSRRAHGRALRWRCYRPGIANIEESKRIDPVRSCFRDPDHGVTHTEAPSSVYVHSSPAA